MARLDLVVIGAGWHGLAMGKAYLEANPWAKMVIIAQEGSVGGTWAKERLYPGLKTNNILGSYEFGDFPMTTERFGVQPGQHIPGTVVHEYLTQFAEHFGLTSRLRLGQKVESAELLDETHWRLQVRSVGDNGNGESITSTIETWKIVVATGLTSQPFIPDFPGREDFGRELFHAKELKHRSEVIEKAQEVLVLGGNKSSWDTSFHAAKSGAHVHMVMRPNGGGPSWVWPVTFSRLKLSIQGLATTRFWTWFDPCIWAERTGWIGWLRKMLHQTSLGQKLVYAVWNFYARSVNKIFRYGEHPSTENLRPWVSPYWMGNSLSTHNYTSPWFDLARQGKITVHIADIVKLSAGTAHLSNGTQLKIDAMVCCTGWTTVPPIRFLPAGLDQKLGIVEPDQPDEITLLKARQEILETIPALRTPPKRTLPLGVIDPRINHNSQIKTTRDRYQLYRFMVPSDPESMKYRHIAFIGLHLALAATIVAQVQALWITGYFSHAIPHLDPETINPEQINYETILHNEYGRIRHPHEAGGLGERCPDLAFDCLAYTDLLLDDLELPKYRKSSVWAEVFQRYMPRDYCDLVEDWLDDRRVKSERKMGLRGWE